MSSVADRVAGVMEALDRRGRPVTGAATSVSMRGSRGVDVVTRELLDGDEPVTAVIASDSLIAMTVFRTIRTLGLRIPEDVSLIAFDNPEWTSITTPPLTVVEQPIYELGAAAARLALQRIRGERVDDEAVVFDARLVRRASVASARVSRAQIPSRPLRPSRRRDSSRMSALRPPERRFVTNVRVTVASAARLARRLRGAQVAERPLGLAVDVTAAGEDRRGQPVAEDEASPCDRLASEGPRRAAHPTVFDALCPCRVCHDPYVTDVNIRTRDGFRSIFAKIRPVHSAA